MTRVSAVGPLKIGLIRFPGSNCDADCLAVIERHFSIICQQVWHTDSTLGKLDGIILPGGFSYGDYLRGGALASHSPIMTAVRDFVRRGGPIIGICNGFQILTESHLLPGALLRNSHRQFICRQVFLTPEVSGNSLYHQRIGPDTLKIPIAHGEGRYYCDDQTLAELKDAGQVFLRYADNEQKSAQPGATSSAFNPNGSVDNIAAITNKTGRILGMMPHPERASDLLVGGSQDGLKVWQLFLEMCA